MSKTSGNREKRQWASLQAELNWKHCHLDAVKSLKRVRNKRVPPRRKADRGSTLGVCPKDDGRTLL